MPSTASYQVAVTAGSAWNSLAAFFAVIAAVAQTLMFWLSRLLRR